MSVPGTVPASAAGALPGSLEARLRTSGHVPGHWHPLILTWPDTEEALCVLIPREGSIRLARTAQPVDASSQFRLWTLRGDAMTPVVDEVECSATANAVFVRRIVHNALVMVAAAPLTGLAHSDGVDRLS